MSFWIPERATEGLSDSIAASGAYGAGYDPIDPNDYGYRQAGVGRREVPLWTLEKARTYSVHAYRTNPMARAIVDTYTAFCVGDSGLTLTATNPEVEQVARDFWTDPRNALDERQELLLRSHLLMGESVFEMMVGAVTGITRLSYADPTGIRRVDLENGNPLWPQTLVFYGPAGNDIRLDVARIDDFTGLRTGDAMFFTSWKALASDTRGMPFLSPVIDWLQAYDDVLYNLVDRTKLMRYMVWDVTVNGSQEDVDNFIAARGGRHAPPTGSVEIHNDAVDWKPQMPQTGAYEDKVTGQSILTEIAAGAGLAKTWLAEPEDANRATSLTMAEPVRRRVRGVQKTWVGYQAELTRYAVDQAVARRRLPMKVPVTTDAGATEMPAASTVSVTGPEIAASDAKVNAEILSNLSLALAGHLAAGTLSKPAAQVAAKKAWEQFVGVPYRPELDDTDDSEMSGKIEQYIEEAEEAVRAAA